eukprot:9671614-Prorocentrum_lima.AAC.1
MGWAGWLWRKTDAVGGFCPQSGKGGYACRPSGIGSPCTSFTPSHCSLLSHHNDDHLGSGLRMTET